MRPRLVWWAIFALAPLPAFAAGTSESDADALKARIIAHSRTVTADDYAYTRTVRTETIESGKTEERVIVERFDPAKPADQRWTLLTFNGQPPSAEQLSSYRKEVPKRRLAYYGRVAGYFAAPATVSADARGRTTFHFAALPKESVMVADADLSANANGEAVVDTTGPIPFVEQSHFTSTKPTRIKLVAKIEHFEMTTRYRLMPDGKAIPVELLSDLTGSMLGSEGRIRTRIIYSDHRALH